MSWILQNNLSNALAIDGILIEPNGSANVGSLTTDMLKAYQDNTIAISPTPLSVAYKQDTITDNTTGSATVNSGAAVPVTSYADANNNFALMLFELNKTQELVNGILSYLQTSNNTVV